MDLKARQELNQGFGNAFSLAVEMVGTPVIFGLIGLFLDHRLGTSPLLLIALGLFGFVGMCVKAYYEYGARMRQHEQAGPWAKK